MRTHAEVIYPLFIKRVSLNKRRIEYLTKAFFSFCLQILQYSLQGGFYQRLKDIMSESVLTQLMRKSVVHLGPEMTSRKISFKMDQLFVIPVLKPLDPCCQYIHDREVPYAHEYAVVIDFDEFR